MRSLRYQVKIGSLPLVIDTLHVKTSLAATERTLDNVNDFVLFERIYKYHLDHTFELVYQICFELRHRCIKE